MKKKIAIIGSGIAGLTLANFLTQDPNFDFIIYEKEDILNLDEGYGIQLSVNSVSILNKIGFNFLNKNEKYNPSKLDFYSINFKKICDLDLTTFNSEKEKYTTLQRSTLIMFLKENLLSNSIAFRKKINKIRQVKEKINIDFTDGSNDCVDYLIVSDGFFSNTKSLIENKTFKPVYCGAIAIRTKVKAEQAQLRNNNISLLMGSNAHIVLYPINKNKELNLVSIIRKKLDNEKDINTILSRTILKQNKSLIDLFKGNLKSWPIYSSKILLSLLIKMFFILVMLFIRFYQQ